MNNQATGLLLDFDSTSSQLHSCLLFILLPYLLQTSV